MCKFCNTKEENRKHIYRLTKLTDGCEGYIRVILKLVGDGALKISIIEEVYDAKTVNSKGEVGTWDSYGYSDEVQIKYCPMCGRKLK